MAAQDFQRVLGSSTDAQQAVREAAIQNFSDFAVDAGGRLNATKARAWMTKYRDALEEFPEVRKIVEEAFKRGEVADAVRLRTEKIVQRVEHSSARFFLDAEPEKAVRRVLASANPQKICGVLSIVSKVNRKR